MATIMPVPATGSWPSGAGGGPSVAGGVRGGDVVQAGAMPSKGSGDGVGPLAPGSVSLRIYPHNDLPATGIVDELRDQAWLAAEHGFDGVMVAEHHGGFAGYLANPIQTAGWMLEAMPAGSTAWAAPCPLLLPLRPAALVAEEIAWLAARFPDRVGLGLAAGALPGDFEIMGVSMDGLTERFAEGLDLVAAALSGRDGGPVAGDPAVARCAEAPVPLVSAAMGLTAVRRAAASGLGLLFDSMSAPERIRRLTDAYRSAGGTGACVLIRRAWVGPPPTDLLERQLDVYRGYAPDSAQAHWNADEVLTAPTAEEVADQLATIAGAAGCNAVNLRIHVPGVTPHLARSQIEQLAGTVAPLHAALPRHRRPGSGHAPTTPAAT
jgi:alkanesulfonate monooxygenase SsuD/methylene tetrahydromethanopterin reductase-like flavin-dependent oxidoreductase (luciferase family)